jgi:demethylmenaquinone methyltransferase / 2-methoxy-6-polyprenyl-1,4-benzoquinol methylase
MKALFPPKPPKAKDSPPSKTDQNEMADFGYRKVPAGQKVNFVRRHFDSIASKYDFMNTFLSFGLHHLWKRRSVRALNLKPGDWVLDACGGTADLSILAAREVGPGGKIVLYDLNLPMMKEGRKKVTQEDFSGRIYFIQGNVEQIASFEGAFDAVMVGFGIRNVTRVGVGLGEMYRVLKPGGKFMCLEFSRPTCGLFRTLYDFYSFQIMPFVGKMFAGTREAYRYLPESIRLFPVQEQFSDVLRKTGFRGVTYKNLTNGIVAVYIGEKNSQQ